MKKMMKTGKIDNQLIFIIVIVLCAGLYFHSQNNRQVAAPPAVPPGVFVPPSVPHQPPQQPQPDPEASKDQARASITAQNCRTIVEHLAGEIGVRVSGTKNYEEEAAPWCKKFFENLGLKSEYQDVPGTGSKNVFAWIEGSDPNEIVVIGGHLDTVSRSPGADDNASGSAAVMELARAYSTVFKETKPPRTILFQLYAAEESGLVGSRYYCNNPTFPKSGPSIKKHIYMLNFDMIGYARQDYNLSVLTEEMAIGGSDHASFKAKGVPAEMNHTGLHQHYHKPSDTPEKLNYDGMCKIVQKGFDTAWDKVHNGHYVDGARYIDPRDMQFPITRDHDFGEEFKFPLEDGVDKALFKAIIEEH